MFRKNFLVILLGIGLGTAAAQESSIEGKADLERLIERKAVPAEVLADAVKAVQDVGEQTLKGNYEGVVEKMYPRYRRRAAKKLGSNSQLVERMRKLVNEYAASGIAITNFVAEPAMHGFDIPEFNEWLVFVPTTRTLRVVNPTTGKTETASQPGYQVAIRSKKEGSTWSFLNGDYKVQELRSLFPSLPADIGEWAIPQKRGK